MPSWLGRDKWQKLGRQSGLIAGCHAGVVPGQYPFVEVVQCTAVQVSPKGHESCWNVDGELLPNNHVTARMLCGLVSVFARGVEETV